MAILGQISPEVPRIFVQPVFFLLDTFQGRKTYPTLEEGKSSSKVGPVGLDMLGQEGIHAGFFFFSAVFFPQVTTSSSSTSTTTPQPLSAVRHLERCNRRRETFDV